MKPKINRVGDKHKSSNYDRCQTPPEALDSIISYLKDKVIWECACGNGNLAERLARKTIVIPTDILDGADFFEWQPANWDVIVTNPPYSIKYAWLERCYELGKPFALLMPVEMLGAQRAQRQFVQHGIEITFLPRRVNFCMPDKGFSGGGAQFPVAWYTWKLTGIPIRFWGLETMR